jgi:hypothetical protein
MDAVTKEKQRIEAEGRKQVDWYQKEMPKFSQAQEKVKAYVDVFGELPPDGSKPKPEAQVIDGKYISKEEHQAAIKEVYEVNKALVKASTDYQLRFGKPLPIDELEKMALTEENRSRPIRDVYNDFIKADMDVKTKAEMETEITRRVTEGVNAEKAKLKFPVEETNRESAPFFTPIEKDKVPNNRGFMETFVQDYREAAPKT